MIRKNKVLLNEGLKNNLSAVGISLKGHETSEEEFEKLIEPLGICLGDLSAIRIIRTIVT